MIRVIKMKDMKDRACWKDVVNAYKKFFKKSQGKKPLKKSRLRWADSIEINFRETLCEGMDWFQETKNNAQ